ncbi:unnamed protein product [Brassica oleracea var. botrytis]
MLRNQKGNNCKTRWTINIRRASCSGSDDGVRVAKAEKEINH